MPKFRALTALLMHLYLNLLHLFLTPVGLLMHLLLVVMHLFLAPIDIIGGFPG